MKLYTSTSLPGHFIAEDETIPGLFFAFPDAKRGWQARSQWKRNRRALVEVDASLAYGTGWPGAPGVGRPARTTAPTSTFSLRLTEQERAEWTELAGDKSLGEWIRERCAAAAAAIRFARAATNGCRNRPTPAGSPRGQGSEAFGEPQGVERSQHPQGQLELASVH